MESDNNKRIGLYICKNVAGWRTNTLQLLLRTDLYILDRTVFVRMSNEDMIATFCHAHLSRSHITDPFIDHLGSQCIYRNIDIGEYGLYGCMCINIPQLIRSNGTYTITIHTDVDNLLSVARLYLECDAFSSVGTSRTRSYATQAGRTNQYSIVFILFA